MIGAGLTSRFSRRRRPAVNPETTPTAARLEPLVGQLLLDYRFLTPLTLPNRSVIMVQVQFISDRETPMPH